MTTNHHTEITVGAAGNASVFNAPLGTLDAAITANTTSIGGLTTTVQTVLNSVILGGAAVTLTNGAADAAQKVVTVDSSAQFVAGAYVEYTLVGGAVERNTVDTVDSPTQISLITNIGTGGIANNSPVAVIPIGFYNATANRFNVKDYGAKGDYSQKDTAAFVAAFAAAAAAATPAHRSIVNIPAGIYDIDPDTLIVTNPYISIQGDGFKVSHLFCGGPGVLLQWAPTSGAYTGVSGSISDLMMTNEGSTTDSACIEVVNSTEWIVDSIISRCWFIGASAATNGAVGIKGKIQQSSIVDCVFEGLKNGIVLNAGTANTQINNCHFYNLRNIAILCDGTPGVPCYNINISNLTFAILGVSGAGPSTITASYTNGLNVSNIHAYNVDNATFLLYGISLGGCSRVSLTNVHIKNAVGTNSSYGAALYIGSCTEVAISNFHALGEASYRPCFGIMATSVSHLFVNNFSIEGALRYGVYLITSATAVFQSGYIGYTGETTPATYAAFRSTDGSVRVRDVFFFTDGSHSDDAFNVTDLDSGDVLIVDGCTYDGGIVAPTHRQGAATPAGSVLPYSIGDEYFDSTGTKWYKATGLTNTDWVALN
jgi:hypothetical protein